MNSYELSRSWFDWSFENPELINPSHSAIFFFAIEHCNRLGWKDKFGFPTQMAMDAIGINKHQTYIKYFNDLVEWGFFKLIKKSTNQYSANIISLQSAKPKNGKALDKALITHTAKQTEPNGQSNSSIDKQDNNKQDNKETISEIVKYLNECLKSKYSPETISTIRLIEARLKEGRTLDDFKNVIDIKFKEWKGNREMEMYLRPETLFGTKFESYLNQKSVSSATATRTEPKQFVPPDDIW